MERDLEQNPKIKTYFDNHNNFISVPCYQLNKSDIKKIINDFLKKNNISLQNEAYWFLIDNISEDFLTLENELQKLLFFKKSSIVLKDLQKLITQKK